MYFFRRGRFRQDSASSSTEFGAYSSASSAYIRAVNSLSTMNIVTSMFIANDRSSMFEDPTIETSSSMSRNFEWSTVGAWYMKIRTPARTSSS